MKLIRRRTFVFACWLWAAVAVGQPVLTDSFNDSLVDPILWTIFRPYTNAPPSVVAETNGALVMFRRGIVESAVALPTSFDMEGRFRFTGDGDALSVVFRSDLSVTNQFERGGVQVAFQELSGRFILIRDPFSTSAPPVQGSFVIGRNQDVRFRIVDHEDVVRVYLDDFRQPLMTQAVTNRRGDRLVLYNAIGTAARTLLDEFSVHPVATTVLIDNQIVRGGEIRRTNAAPVRLQSFYTNAVIFYTLDGSEPSFVSSEYTAPFSVDSSATLRAIAYSSDFGNSMLSPVIDLQIIPDVVLTNLTPGGGVVQFEPPGPVYPSNSVVTGTAVPAPGWQFLRWEGVAVGESNPTAIAMTNNAGIRAVFAAVPAFSVVGNGQPATTPEGPLIEYGTRVRLTAYPGDGSYFVRWGNAVTGTNNPVTFLFTNISAAITVLFAALPPNVVSLVTAIDGDGRIASAPAGNTFALGQTVSVLALPEADRVFLGWSGAVNSRTNPVALLMNSSKVITARFGRAVRFLPVLRAWTSNGFSLSFTGQVGMTYDLEATSNFVDWTSVAPLLNETGRVDFLHSVPASGPALFYRVVGP